MNILEVFAALTIMGVGLVVWIIGLLTLHEVITDSKWYEQLTEKRMNK